MPCGQFEANASFFATGVLACNLFKLLDRRALPGGYRRARSGTVRHRLYRVAGRAARTGRPLVLYRAS